MLLLSVLYNLKICCQLLNVQVSIKDTGCAKYSKAKQNFFICACLNALIVISNTIFNLMSIYDMFVKDLDPKILAFTSFVALEFLKNDILSKCTGFY